MIRLTTEQTEAVKSNPTGVECQGDGTDQLFVIIDAAVLHQMQKLLHEKDVHQSIANGLMQMEAGECRTVAESRVHVRKTCGLPELPES